MKNTRPYDPWTNPGGVRSETGTHDAPPDDKKLADFKVAKDDGMNYGCWGLIVGGITFFASWVYCIAEYGYLLGVGLGWLPSLIVGVIAGLLWPLVLGALGLLFLLLYLQSR